MRPQHDHAQSELQYTVVSAAPSYRNTICKTLEDRVCDAASWPVHDTDGQIIFLALLSLTRIGKPKKRISILYPLSLLYIIWPPARDGKMAWRPQKTNGGVWLPPGFAASSAKQKIIGIILNSLGPFGTGTVSGCWLDGLLPSKIGPLYGVLEPTLTRCCTPTELNCILHSGPRQASGTHPLDCFLIILM